MRKTANRIPASDLPGIITKPDEPVSLEMMEQAIANGAIGEKYMTRRLKEVVSKLYKPITPLTRQVFALSQVEAEQLPRLSTVAIISITSPKRPSANLDGFAHVLRLSFADVNFLSPELSLRAREKVPDAFTATQAQQIQEFVEGLPEDIVSIVVHCGAGQSRSCGIALGLHRLYGYQIEMERMENANPSVVKVLTVSKRPVKKSGK